MLSYYGRSHIMALLALYPNIGLNSKLFSGTQLLFVFVNSYVWPNSA